MIQDGAPETRQTPDHAGPTSSHDGPPARDAYARLKRLIAQNGFRPGQHLMARDLADDLRVSTTPVREALIRLSVEGAIDAVPHKGFYIKPIDAAEIADWYELAFMIASHAVRTRLDPPTEHTPDPTTDHPVPAAPAGDPADPAASGTTARFEIVLDAIARSSGNRQASALMRGFNDRTRYLRRIANEESGAAASLAGDLDRLDVALAARDAAGAVASLRCLLLGHRERLALLVEEANGRAQAASSGETHGA